MHMIYDYFSCICWEPCFIMFPFLGIFPCINPMRDICPLYLLSGRRTAGPRHSNPPSRSDLTISWDSTSFVGLTCEHEVRPRMQIRSYYCI